MDWEPFIGRFHPILVHLPIGIFILGFCLELLLQFKVRLLKNSRQLIILTYGIGLFFGILAALSGWLLSLNGHYEPEPLEDHKLLGIATLVLMAIVILVQLKASEHRSRLKFVISAVAIVLTGLTGHFGGSLTHGSDYLFKYASKTKSAETYVPIPDVTGIHVDSIKIYADIIQPLIQSKCYACHNTEISRGGLVLETYADLFKDDNHERPIVVGNAQKSELFYRMTLPDDDEKVMPPRGNRFEYTNLQILKYWIETGADSLASFNSETMSNELIALLHRDYQLDYSPRPYFEKIKLDSIDADMLANIKASGFVVNYLAENNLLLDVRFSGDSLTQDHIKHLNEVADHITFLDLKESQLTAELVAEISEIDHLTRINLSKNPFSENLISFLIMQEHLETINLNETELDLNALKRLVGLPSLKRVYVWNTTISAEDLEALRRSYEKIEFISEFKFEEVKEAKSVFASEEAR